MKFFKLFLIILSIVLIVNSCKKDPDNPVIVPPVIEKTDYKILFVGNSYTHYNDGVDYHLQKMLMADKSSDSINYAIEKIAISSYTLETHYADQLTINKINSQKWNIVVLQEQSTRPINNPDLFLEYARKLDVEIKKANAKTSLFMTWPPKDQPEAMMAIESAYISAGSQLNAEVAPVGKVWEYIQKTTPQIELYISDNKHPTLSGTYANACVFYAVLLKKNPVENTYVPGDLDSANAVSIRKSVDDYLKLNK